jgi:hypothetical protein
MPKYYDAKSHDYRMICGASGSNASADSSDGI